MQDAISVIETDCEVDFAPPLDYVEPQREERAATAAPSLAADAAGECGHAALHTLPKTRTSGP